MQRYDRSDFEPWISDEVIDGVTLGGPVGIDPACAMPDKFHDLNRRSKKFKQSWEKTRTDLKDTSMSGFDLSLAGLCVGDGWTDQEITDLLIKFAQFHKAVIKDARYYRHTIAKARKGMSAEGVVTPERILDFDKAIAEVYGTKHNDEKQDKIKDLLVKVNEEIGTSIVRVVRYPAVDPTMRPRFRIYFVGQVVHFANGSELECQALFWSKLREHKIVGGKRKKKNWDKIADAIAVASEDEQTEEEAVTSEGIGRSLVREYLQAFPPVEDATTAHEKYPFIKDGEVCFFSKELAVWAANTQHQWPTAQTLSMYLRDAGCGNKAVRHPRTKRVNKMWMIGLEKLGVWDELEPVLTEPSRNGVYP